MSDWSTTPGRVTRPGDVRLTGRRVQRIEDHVFNVRGNLETVHDADSSASYADTLGADEGWGVGLDEAGRLCVGLGRTAETPGLAYLGLDGAMFPGFQGVVIDEDEWTDEQAGAMYLVYAKMRYNPAGVESYSSAVDVRCYAVPVEQAADIQEVGSVSIPLGFARRVGENEWTDLRQLHFGPLNLPLRMG